MVILREISVNLKSIVDSLHRIASAEAIKARASMEWEAQVLIEDWRRHYSAVRPQ